jgi:hypothetical protein
MSNDSNKSECRRLIDVSYRAFFVLDVYFSLKYYSYSTSTPYGTIVPRTIYILLYPFGHFDDIFGLTRLYITMMNTQPST